MGLIPLIQRELRIGARDPATYRGRLITAGVVMTVFFITVVTQADQQMRMLGPMVLGMVTMIVFIQAFFAGLRHTADCLSFEKREGTLGLLYLSGLKSVEIVLSKLVSTSLRAFYGLIAALPVFALCILLGGVTGQAAFELAVTLICMMWFSLTLGLVVSAIWRDEKAVFTLTLGGLIFFFAGIPLLWKLLTLTFGPNQFFDSLLYLSPGYFWQIGGAATTTTRFWTSVLGTSAVTLCFISVAAFALPSWLRQSFAQPPRQPALRSRSGHPAIPDGNPYSWLLRRDKVFKRALIFLALTAAIFAVTLLSTSIAVFPGPGLTFVLMGLYCGHQLLKILAAAVAARQLSDDRRSGALELLLSTPLKPHMILRAQSRHMFQVAAIALFAVSLANLAAFRTDPFDEMPAMILGGILTLFVDSFAVSWIAMLEVMRGRRYPVAVLKSLLLVVVIPSSVMFLTMVGSRGVTTDQMNIRVAIWIAVALIYDAILIRRASRMLRTRFHELASGAIPESASRPRWWDPWPSSGQPIAAS